jgi:hypothetical protein
MDSVYGSLNKRLAWRHQTYAWVGQEPLLRMSYPRNCLVVFTTLRFSPGNLASEGVQVFLPKSAKLGNPGIDLLKRLRVHRIDSSLPFDADSDHSALAQCSEMLRDGRLRDAELFLNHVRDTSGIAFATDEKFQNPASHGIAENIKTM